MPETKELTWQKKLALAHQIMAILEPAREADRENILSLVLHLSFPGRETRLLNLDPMEARLLPQKLYD